FAKLMNERAISAGAINTHFANPNGLHDQAHVTTAYDMAMITREALKNDEFRRILGTTSYQIPPTNKQAEIRYLWNTHKMLKDSDFFYEKAIGGKTGYTSEALNTLVTVAKDGDRELIVVLLKNQSGGNNYRDTAKLFDYGFNDFKQVQLTKDNINIEDEADDFAVSKVEATKILLHDSLSEDDIVVNFKESQSDSNPEKKEFSIKLDDKTDFMYSSLGEVEFEIPDKNSILDSDGSSAKSKIVTFFKGFLRVVMWIVTISAVSLLVIYFYVNRNYYRKKIMRKLRKKKNRNNKNIKRKKVS
ncbi:MAG: hypothetical protein WBH44_10690, partial [Proteocatella sp.]